jgi:hypothetical protein
MVPRRILIGRCAIGRIQIDQKMYTDVILSGANKSSDWSKNLVGKDSNM